MITPGPWRFRNGAVVSEEGWPIAKLDMRAPENEANGRLMAASPDLLREAKGLLEALEMEGADSQLFYDWSNGLKDAIAKAEPRA